MIKDIIRIKEVLDSYGIESRTLTATGMKTPSGMVFKNNKLTPNTTVHYDPGKWGFYFLSCGLAINEDVYQKLKKEFGKITEIFESF